MYIGHALWAGYVHGTRTLSWLCALDTHCGLGHALWVGYVHWTRALGWLKPCSSRVCVSREPPDVKLYRLGLRDVGHAWWPGKEKDGKRKAVQVLTRSKPCVSCVSREVSKRTSIQGLSVCVISICMCYMCTVINQGL